MKQKTISGELTQVELIIYQTLVNDTEIGDSELASILSKNDPEEASPNAWEHRIRRFKQKFPNWKKDDLSKETIAKVAEGLHSEHIMENRTLRNKVRELQATLVKITNKANEKLEYYSNLADAIPALPLVKDVPIIGKRTGTVKEEDVVLLLSDVHINRVIDNDEMEGYNEYNFDIFCNRYWFLLTEVVKIVNAQRYDKTINTLYIDCLGDMFNDIYREENMRSNQFNPVQALILGTYVLAQGICLLTPHFKKIVFTGIIGNESRWDKNKPSKDKSNNMDYESYHFMSLMLRDHVKSGKVVFNIPVSPETVVERRGKKFLLVHGDAIKSSLGFPAYGVNRDYSKQQDMRRRKGGFDYMELGHFHSEYSLQSKIFMNGSICGIDEYAKNTLHVTGNPSQKLFGLNDKYGVSWQYDIQLQHAKENGFMYNLKSAPVSGIAELTNTFDNADLKLNIENTLKEPDLFKTKKKK